MPSQKVPKYSQPWVTSDGLLTRPARQYLEALWRRVLKRGSDLSLAEQELSDIDDVSGILVSLQAQITSLQDQISDIEDGDDLTPTLNALQAQVDSLDVRVGALETKVTDHESRLVVGGL